jgi:hypothetical protein
MNPVVGIAGTKGHKTLLDFAYLFPLQMVLSSPGRIVCSGEPMKPIGYARSRDYWTRFGWGTLMGLIGAVFAFVYIVMVHGIEQLPREVLRTNLFSSVAGAFGLLIGLLGMYGYAPDSVSGQ